MTKNNMRGFTLIELMISITIIALLSSGALVAFNSARENARDAKRSSQVEQLSLALETYRQTIGAYPSGLSALAPTYIAEVPNDPSGNAYSYGNATCNGVNRTVVYSKYVEKLKNAQTMSCTTGIQTVAGKYQYIVVVGAAH